jgi:glucosamine 6-phosphate synthetase-like amidotransferase/phosphosugar isomerase protein
MENAKEFLDILYNEIFPKGEDQEKEEVVKIVEFSHGKLDNEKALAILMKIGIFFALFGKKGYPISLSVFKRLLKKLFKETRRKIDEKEALEIGYFISCKFADIKKDVYESLI